MLRCVLAPVRAGGPEPGDHHWKNGIGVTGDGPWRSATVKKLVGFVRPGRAGHPRALELRELHRPQARAKPTHWCPAGAVAWVPGPGRPPGTPCALPKGCYHLGARFAGRWRKYVRYDGRVEGRPIAFSTTPDPVPATGCSGGWSGGKKFSGEEDPTTPEPNLPGTGAVRLRPATGTPCFVVGADPRTSRRDGDAAARGPRQSTDACHRPPETGAGSRAAWLQRCTSITDPWFRLILSSPRYQVMRGCPAASFPARGPAGFGTAHHMTSFTC